ncbi:unnamed protein product [Cylindrotheca closterium]|uniref:Uncharacterized protein n=1 Tax=Cylindrotheca closterium TaxID=2856 RepID=A0AAD2GBN0_9STRA|nr:unnamed protein product [Cylindrotheca closterium]
MNFKTIIEQNDETLAFLRTRDYSKAAVASSTALKCLRSLQEQCAGASKGCCNELYSSTCSDGLDQCMLLSKVEDESSFEANDEFIYKHGISLHSEVIGAEIITSVLLFNTALAHHMLAIEQQQHQALLKAKRLYELAYSAYEMDHNILFQFAVINNIVVIDRKLGNEVMPNECLAHLISLFMVFVDQGCNMHLRHVQGFLVNLPWSIDTAVAA